jgi:hypothetical protein
LKKVVRKEITKKQKPEGLRNEKNRSSSNEK